MTPVTSITSVTRVTPVTSVSSVTPVLGCSSLLDQFASELLAQYLPIPPMLLRVLRILRILRILRLLKGAKQLRDLLVTMILSFPSLLNVASLLGLIIFIYAVLGVNLFTFLVHQVVPPTSRSHGEQSLHRRYPAVTPTSRRRYAFVTWRPSRRRREPHPTPTPTPHPPPTLVPSPLSPFRKWAHGCHAGCGPPTRPRAMASTTSVILTQWGTPSLCCCRSRNVTM